MDLKKAFDTYNIAIQNVFKHGTTHEHLHNQAILELYNQTKYLES